MIQCPKCSQSLPDSAQRCQFCGTDIPNAFRPKASAKKDGNEPYYVDRGLVWTIYYILSALWMLDGIRMVIPGILAMGKGPGTVFEGLGVVFIVIGVVNILMGLGLILKIELVRGIANFLAGINLLLALFSLVGAIFGSALGGMSGFLWVLLAIFQVCLYGAQIWVIGETDR